MILLLSDRKKISRGKGRGKENSLGINEIARVLFNLKIRSYTEKKNGF